MSGPVVRFGRRNFYGSNRGENSGHRCRGVGGGVDIRQLEPNRPCAPSFRTGRQPGRACLDGTPSSRGLVEALRTLRVRSCLRPHMRAPPSIRFSADGDPRRALFPQASPANLTSGGITIPATVPHAGRESFEGTAPLCKDDARRHAEDRRRSLGSPVCMPSQCRPVPATVRWRAS